MLAIDYKREEFKETLAVRASVQGRAPVAVDDLHVACVDRSGMNVQLYVYDNAKFPKACLLEVSKYLETFNLPKDFTHISAPK